MPTLTPTEHFAPPFFGRAIYGASLFGPDGPTTVDEIKDQPNWFRNPDVPTYYLAQSDPGGIPIVTTPVAARSPFLVPWIYDDARSAVEEVEDWVRLGKLKLTIDEASSFSFSVKGDSSHVANLVRPNLIWLRDRWGFLISTFRISKTIQNRRDDSYMFDVHLKDALEQLGREPVVSYDTASQSIETTVQELLEDQDQSPPVVLGHIDKAIAEKETAFDAHDTTVLGALRSLQMTQPKNARGYFYIDSANRLNWRVNIGSRRGESLTVGSGLNKIGLVTDSEELITRLYFFGRGENHIDRVKLTDEGADEANVYIDSVNVASFGIVPRIITDRRFRDPASMLKAAQRVLAEYDEPEVRVLVDEMLDVAKADGSRFPNANDLYIGSQYRVVDAKQSIDTTVFVTSIEYDVEDPIPVRITLTNRRRRMSDFLRTLYEQLAQPLDIMDGDRYPKHGRNLDQTEAADDATYPNFANRAGDWSPQARMEYWDGSAWEPVADLSDVATDGTDIQRHRGTVDAGADEDLYAREKHRHPGVPYYEAANKAGIDAITPAEANAIAYNTGENLWFRRNDANNAWILDQMFFATTKAGLPNLNSAYNAQAFGGVSGGVDEGAYIRIRGAWERLVVHYDTAEPFAPVGSLYTNGDDEVFAKSEAELIGGTPNVWIGITHIGSFVP